MKKLKYHLQEYQKHKYLGINLMKDDKVYTENSQTLLRQVKGDTNNWEVLLPTCLCPRVQALSSMKQVG